MRDFKVADLGLAQVCTCPIFCHDLAAKRDELSVLGADATTRIRLFEKLSGSRFGALRRCSGSQQLEYIGALEER